MPYLVAYASKNGHQPTNKHATYIHRYKSNIKATCDWWLIAFILVLAYLEWIGYTCLLALVGGYLTRPLAQGL